MKVRIQYSKGLMQFLEFSNLENELNGKIYDVPDDKVEKWKKAIKDFFDAQEEMQELIWS